MALKIGDEPVPGYRLVKFLGRGGFGQVWEATSPGGIHVAMKIIDVSGREGMKEFKALRLMKSVRQANLTPLLAFWLKDDQGNLVDEAQAGDLTAMAPTAISATQGTVLLEDINKMRPSELIIAMGLGDKTLSDRLKECQHAGHAGIPLEELFKYMGDAARAIDFLNTPRHDLGHGPISPIQHCDIKPQNILIVGDTAQVCDFGLARELGVNVKITSAAVSPAYGAPELIEGRPPSGATDQYSLAITYVELRTGRLPFTDPDSYMQVIHAHLNGTLDLSQLSPDEQSIVAKATSRDPYDRFENAARMVKALERACPGDDAVGPGDGGIRQTRPHIDVTRDNRLSGLEPRASGIAQTAMLPADTRETPHAGFKQTRIDTRATAAYAEPMIEIKPPGRSWGRIGKRVGAGVLTLALAALAVIYLRPAPNPELQDYADALQDLDTAKNDADLSRKATLLHDVIVQCERYPEADAFRKLLTRAATMRAEALEVAEKSVLPLVEKAEALVDAEPAIAASLSKAVGDFEQVLTVLNPFKQVTYTALRARLGAARAKAKGTGELPTQQQLDDLQRQSTELSQVRAPVHQAQLIVLRALESKQRDAGDPTLALNELEKLSLDHKSLLRSLASESWESQQIAAICQWASEHYQPKDPPADVKRIVREMRPVDTAELLDKVGKHWQEVMRAAEPERAAALDAFATALATARSAAAESDEAKQLDAWEHLATLADPRKDSSQLDAALGWFTGNVATADAGQLVDLAWALSDLTARDPGRLDAAVSLAEAAQGRFPGEPEIVLKTRELQGRQIAEMIAHPAQPLEPKEYFPRLQAVCQRAREAQVPDPLVNVALVESLVEQGQPVDRALASFPAEQPYEKYVRLLVRATRDDFKLDPADQKDLTAVAEAARDKTGLGLEVDYRRARLAAMLSRAAAALRTPLPTDESPFDAVIHPFGTEGTARAQLASEWLKTAGRIAKSRDVHMAANLALATWHKTPEGAKPSDAELQNLRSGVKGLMARQADLGDDALAVMYLDAVVQPDTPEGRLQSLTSRANLADKLSSEPLPSDEQIVRLYDVLIAPALDGASGGKDAAINQQLARLAYRKGRVLRDYRTAAWPFDADQEKLKANQLAAKWQPDNADYVAARGFALLDLKSPDLAAAQADASEAIRLAPKAHAGYGLLAKVCLTQSRQKVDRQREALLEQAVEASNRAIERAADDSDSRRFYLLDLGAANVEWANFVDPTKRAPADLLQAAIDCVHQAQQLSQLKSFADYAYITLGNAHEDLAWLVQQDVDKNYDAAIDAFSQAIALRRDLPLPYLHLGRCYLKRERDSNQKGKGYAELARENLELAVGKDEELPTVRRWLGEVYAYEKQYSKADEEFAAAMALAEKNHSADYSVYAALWAGARLNDKSFAMSDVRARVDGLLAKPPQDKAYRNRLQLIRGNSFVIEQKWDDARKQYAAALPAELAQTDKLDAGLLEAKVKCDLEHPAKASKATYEAIAKEADRFIELRQPFVQWNDYYLNAAAHYLDYVYTPKAEQAKRIDKPLASFAQAVARAPRDHETLQLLKDNVTLLSQAITADRAAKQQARVPAWYATGTQLIATALTLARPGDEKSDWQRRKAEFEKLKP